MHSIHKLWMTLLVLPTGLKKIILISVWNINTNCVL